MTTTSTRPGSRANGTNPRAQGTNPRARGESPRQTTPVTRADLDRLEAKVDRILARLEGPPQSARPAADHTRFLPGTGPMDLDPNRPRPPHVQAVIDRDN